MRGLIFLVIVYIVKWIIDEISKPVDLDVDQIINAITEKKPVKYISNGVELKTNFTEHYFKILDMENLKEYDQEIILNQAKKQQSYFQEDVKVGYKTRCSSKDIKLAETYILDNYNYLAYLN
jgi:hypothetical protein